MQRLEEACHCWMRWVTCKREVTVSGECPVDRGQWTEAYVQRFAGMVRFLHRRAHAKDILISNSVLEDFV